MNCITYCLYCTHISLSHDLQPLYEASAYLDSQICLLVLPEFKIHFLLGLDLVVTQCRISITQYAMPTRDSVIYCDSNM